MDVIATPPRDPPIATLADGSRLRGVAIGDVDAYRGVPFALPPLGDGGLCRRRRCRASRGASRRST